MGWVGQHEMGQGLRGSAIAVLFAMGLAGCGSQAPVDSPVCTRGETRRCSAGCADGTQTCSGSPPRWGECVCDEPEPDAGPMPLPRLGTPCDEDDDCPAPGFCLTPDSSLYFGGGPTQGLCVADCTETATVCERFRDALCVDVTRGRGEPEPHGRDAGPEPKPLDASVIDAGAMDAAAADAGPSDAGAFDASTADGGRASVHRALCFPQCSVGASKNACGDDTPVACEPLMQGDTRGFCRPLCATDQDCGARRCDPRHGTCVDELSSTATFGRACDPEAAVAACDGLCVTLDEDTAYCSHRCRFGSTDVCRTAAAGAAGACLLVTPGGGLGDVGYCGVLCDCNDDCSASGTVCLPFEDAALKDRFQANGVCRAGGDMGAGLACEGNADAED